MTELPIIIILVIIIIFSRSSILLLIRRHFKTYDEQILEFLKANGLNQTGRHKPTKADWQNAPFDKPPIISFSFIQIQFLGMHITSKDTRYEIIETNENKHVWIEINTRIFYPAKLNFKIEKSSQTATQIPSAFS